MNSDYAEDREPLDTKNMLEQGFLNRLGKIGSNINSIPNAEEAKPSINRIVKSDYNTEKLLLDLYDVRDDLINTYSKIGIGAYSQSFVHGINKIGGCIRTMGGDIDDFDPLAHMSGLQNPNIIKNAKRVIENTIDAYTLGKVDDVDIKDSGKTILLSFVGQQGQVSYKAIGTLKAKKTWVGNEAIDYIYSPSEGRMSVKVFSDDEKWVDKSNNYEISWELFEDQNDFNVMASEGDNISMAKEAGKKESDVEIKEEIKNDTKNNNNDEEIGDFIIEEKDKN